MELPAEERPLLREARNVRNSQFAAPAPTDGGEGVSARLVNGTSRKPPHSGDQPYAIGDRKVFGVAQVKKWLFVVPFYCFLFDRKEDR